MRYGVLAHRDPIMVRRLAEALGPRAVVRVHLDARVDLSDFESEARLRDLPDAEYTTNRVAVNWGGATMVKAMRYAFEAHLDAAPSENVTWLSGSCYPVRPVAEFEQFVTDTRTPVLARGYSLATATRWHRQRLLRSHFFDVTALNRLPHGPRRVLRRGLSLLAPNPGSRALLEKAVAGSQWMSLPSECASYAFRALRTSRFTPLLRGFAADEMALQTVLMSSRWAGLTPDGGALELPNPKVSELSVFHLLTQNMKGRPSDEALRNPPKHAFFSRKFDSTLDAHILDEVNERLGGN